MKTAAGWRVPVACGIKGKQSALKKNRFLKWSLSSKLVFFTVVSIISAGLICHLSNCRLNLICKGSCTLVVVCLTAFFFFSKNTAKEILRAQRKCTYLSFLLSSSHFFRCRCGRYLDVWNSRSTFIYWSVFCTLRFCSKPFTLKGLGKYNHIKLYLITE